MQHPMHHHRHPENRLLTHRTGSNRVEFDASGGIVVPRHRRIFESGHPTRAAYRRQAVGTRRTEELRRREAPFGVKCFPHVAVVAPSAAAMSKKFWMQHTE